MKVIPIALVGILAFLPSFALAQPQQKEDPNGWAKAEAKIEAHLKGIDPKMRYAEFKSERLGKYLPEFRVFVRFDEFKVSESQLFLVNQDAEITGIVYWKQVAQIAEFLRARKIRVETREDASEFAQFFVELQGAPSYVAQLHINTRNFTVFDKRFIESHCGPNVDWKYTGEKREGGWKVTVTYVGDPDASIMMPPTYEIDIDAQGNFRDLRAKNGSGILLEGE